MAFDRPIVCMANAGIQLVYYISESNVPFTDRILIPVEGDAKVINKPQGRSNGIIMRLIAPDHTRALV